MDKDDEKKLQSAMMGAGVMSGHQLAKHLSKVAPGAEGNHSEAKFKELTDTVRDKGFSLKDDPRGGIDFEKGFIQAQDSDTLAHELSHLENRENSLIPDRVQKGLYEDIWPAAKKISGPSAAIGIGGHNYFKDKNPNLAKGLLAGGLVGSATTMPRVIEEARANISAVKNHGADAANAARSMATYAPEALPFLATSGYALKQYLDKRREEDGNKSNR